MAKVIEMSTGKIIEDEFGAFEDEVLNAEWMPIYPQLELEVQAALSRAAAAGDEMDADAFLATMYRSQQ